MKVETKSFRSASTDAAVLLRGAGRASTQSERHDGDWKAAHPLQEGGEATAKEAQTT
jgi:hypothetical protein